MGAARRRRQLRRRDPFRVRPAPGLDGARRHVDVPVRARRGGAARLPRVGGRRAGRGDVARGDQLCPAGAVRAAGAGRAAGAWSLVGCWCGDLAGAGGARAAAWPRTGRRPVRADALPGAAADARRRARPRSAELLPRRVPSPTSATRSSRRCSSTAPGCPRRCPQIHLHQMGGAVGRAAPDCRRSAGAPPATPTT